MPYYAYTCVTISFWLILLTDGVHNVCTATTIMSAILIEPTLRPSESIASRLLCGDRWVVRAIGFSGCIVWQQERARLSYSVFSRGRRENEAKVKQLNRKKANTPSNNAPFRSYFSSTYSRFYTCSGSIRKQLVNC